MTETGIVGVLTVLASVVGAYLSARATNRQSSVDLQGVVDNRVRLVMDQMAERLRDLEKKVEELEQREREWELLFRSILPTIETHEPGLVDQLRGDYPSLKL